MGIFYRLKKYYKLRYSHSGNIRKIEIPFTTMEHPPCRITDSNTLIDSEVLTSHRDINELIDKFYQDLIQKKTTLLTQIHPSNKSFRSVQQSRNSAARLSPHLTHFIKKLHCLNKAVLNFLILMSPTTLYFAKLSLRDKTVMVHNVIVQEKLLQRFEIN